ncbi:hypothetical protein HNQ93_000894 [Hymenobacter luteus]|uniref:Uncharacterized protein n=2 Tax=Hymenobacter TaxID=89966 RepID=A0A7W9SZI5_9BACT|nr:hypothetical protein [Hymenobacter latericoloratus]MBB6058064.1 hypothetical protein [Hymenobacter luteus]
MIGQYSIWVRYAIIFVAAITGCIPYTNRTSYNAFNVVPISTTVADSITPIVAFSLNRQLTSKVYPFVGYLGEKGDFSLGVQLYGNAASRYRELVLKSIRVESGGKVHFHITDSSFVKLQGSRATDNMRYYKSDYTIALDDTVKKATIKADYDLITHGNRREQYSLISRWYMDRKRGLDGY